MVQQSASSTRLDALRKVALGIFGGRYSRGAWVAASVAYGLTLAILVLPAASYLWTSPRIVREAYVVFALTMLALCMAGLGLSYAKRLQDQNISGWWALVVLGAVPWALLTGAQAWVSHLYSRESATTISSSDYYTLALVLWLGGAVILALRPSRAADRFGPQIRSADVLRPKHIAALLVGVCATTVLVASAYAGHIQRGVWVGRAEFGAFASPAISAPGGGRVVASCGNAKGVSAVSHQGEESGFTRDAVGGTWAVVLLPDGTWDIQTFNANQVLSFRDDGFAVRVLGYPSPPVDGSAGPKTDHFMVTAEAANPRGDVFNVTTISLVKRDYRYEGVISSSRTMGKGGVLTTNDHPRASSYLMIADCSVF